MPFFSYSGRTANGELVQGVLESADSNAAAGQLFTTGIIPIDIRPAKAPAKSVDEQGWNPFAEKVTHLDVMMFSRQMHTLMKAGIPMMSALGGLQASTPSKVFADVIRQIRESLDSGRELSSALRQHPKAFNPFYVSMVRVGESTGMLESVFMRLFQHMEFEKFMREQIRSALRYPTFVVGVMMVALVIINLFVIPAFAKVFKGFNAELPLLTRILINVSDFFLAYWAFMLMAVVAGVFVFRAWVKTSEGRYQWDAFKLKLPIAGKIVRKATMARFARGFALAARSGVPIVQGMTLVAQTVDNDFVAEKVEQMRTGVERGESILRTAMNSGVFNPVVLQMIAVGEESGMLDDMMQEIADMYQQEVEYEIKTLGSQIEPILIVMLGVLVLILALGVFLPIWDLGRVALHK
jgi:MSHA biogenesis protein MshG